MKCVLSHTLLALAAVGSVVAAPWYNQDMPAMVRRDDIPSLESVPAESLAAPQVVQEAQTVAKTDPQALNKGYGTLCVRCPSK